MPRPITLGGPDYARADRTLAAWLRLTAGHAASRIPYGGLSRVLRRLAAQRALRTLLRRRELEALEQLRPLVSQAVDWAVARRRHVVSWETGLMGALRLSAAEAAPWKGLQPWFSFNGLERLRKTVAEGRGALLLNSHFGSGHFLPIALLKLGFELCSVHQADLFKHLPADLADRFCVLWIDEAFPARALLEAKRRLQGGALVHIVGDEGLGRSSIEREFLGRRWRFPSSYAALAVSTNVPVFPVMAPTDEFGITTFHMHPPLDRGDENRPLEDQVQSMVANYVHLLGNYWINDPGNIHANMLRRFLTKPYYIENDATDHARADGKRPLALRDH